MRGVAAKSVDLERGPTEDAGVEKHPWFCLDATAIQAVVERRIVMIISKLNKVESRNDVSISVRRVPSEASRSTCRDASHYDDNVHLPMHIRWRNLAAKMRKAGSEDDAVSYIQQWLVEIVTLPVL